MTKPPKTNSPKVFISYAWENQTTARQLQRDLQRDGIEVFVDYEKIVGGDSLPARICAALDWCDIIILLWSQAAAKSYWVAQEWESAFQMQKRIIPCVLESATLPALLRGRLYLDFSSYAAGYRQLCRTLGVTPGADQAASLPPLTESVPRQHVDSMASNQLQARTAPHVSKKFQPSALEHGVKPPAASPAEPARSETSVQINKPSRLQRNKIFLVALGLAATFIIGRLLWQTIPQAVYPDPSKFEPVEQKSPEAPEGMVLIPAGSFMMGSEDGDSDEKPVHEVYVNAFYLDQYEVTVAKFREFVTVSRYKTDAEKEGFSYVWNGKEWEKKEGINWRHNAEGKISADNLPVINVSWNDAMAYAKWAKKRLPTEAEWEYAARSGSKGHKYAWGNGSPFGRNGGNVADASAKRLFGWSGTWEGYDDGFVYTAPVGSFAPNDFKLYDMTGNVWEWCSSQHKPYPYKSIDGREAISGSDRRVLRGGAWNDYPQYVRCAYRLSDLPTLRGNAAGFRCAQDAR